MSLGKSKYVNLIRLLRNERRSLDELINLQNIALRRLVRHAYNTTNFYKKLFDGHGVNPYDIRTIEDITKLPVIDKQILKQNSFDDLISKEYKDKKLISITTSGSSGVMLKFFTDDAYDQFRKAQFLRPYITNGRRLFDRTIIFSAPKNSKKKWFQRMGFMPDNRVFYNTSTQEKLEAINRVKPAVIQGCGSVLNLLALEILENHYTIKEKPRLIFSDSEVLTSEMRESIQRAFGAPVYGIYGTYESDNIGYECSCKNGYHIALDCVIMEVLNEGKTSNFEGDGEVVLTILNNYTMPFIRYNLHDIGSFSKLSCRCGRSFPLLTEIKGRSDNYMITPNGKKLSFVNLGAYWHSLTNYVHEYQVIQKDPDNFSVFLVPNSNYNDTCREIITFEILKYFPNANIDIKLVQSIKRHGDGKFMTFISKLK
jgi:phenylacetate-coenzyme A ligase PaaK-like adenylate-forming protein